MAYNQGQNNPMFGRKHSSITKEKMCHKAMGIKNSQWKGDKVEYQSLHCWIRSHFGQPTTCERCGTKNLIGKKINWANKSGKYLRLRSDWERICVKCHRASYTKPHTVAKGSSRNCILNRS